MAKLSLMVKAARPNKFPVRNYTRCRNCGRPRAYIGDGVLHTHFLLSFPELPAGLGYARDLTLRGQFTETNAAELELADVGTGATAVPATGIVPNRELVGAGSLDH